MSLTKNSINRRNNVSCPGVPKGPLGFLRDTACRSTGPYFRQPCLGGFCNMETVHNEIVPRRVPSLRNPRSLMKHQNKTVVRAPHSFVLAFPLSESDIWMVFQHRVGGTEGLLLHLGRAMQGSTHQQASVIVGCRTLRIILPIPAIHGYPLPMLPPRSISQKSGDIVHPKRKVFKMQESAASKKVIEPNRSRRMEENPLCGRYALGWQDRGSCSSLHVISRGSLILCDICVRPPLLCEGYNNMLNGLRD